MGILWSSRRRHNPHPHHHPSPSQNPYLPQPSPPPQLLYSSHPPPPASIPPPSQPTAQHPPPSYAFAANSPLYPTHQYLPSHSQAPPAHYPPSYSSGYFNYTPYYSNHSSGYPVLTPQPAPYVDHQNAKTVKNDVNVHKDTIKIELDESNPDSYLLSFTFDATFDGSITIFYFAKEGKNCTFTPYYPEIYMSVRIPFQKGPGQKFYQPSGTGIDLGFFDLNDLSRPVSGEDIFPLVISAESYSPSLPMDKQLDEPLPAPFPHAQITQAVLEKGNDGKFQVRVMKQILCVDGVRYEMREIYGIGNLDKTAIDDTDSGQECVICLTEPKDTVIFPCRHMCMCRECAKALRFQSNKCPICRQPIQELREIKVAEESS